MSEKIRIETIFDPPIVTAIVHGSNKNKLIFQIPLQKAHSFSLARPMPAAAAFLASPEPIVLLQLVGNLPPVPSASAADAEAELGGTEEGESGAEEREEDR